MSKNRDIRFNRERMLEGAAFYAKFGITPQTYQIRVEVDLVEGQGVYEFDIQKKQKSATEKVIRNNDLFIQRAIGMALMVEANAAKGTAPLLSYPLINGLHLPTGIKGFTNANAYALYNGGIAMKTDQSVNWSIFPATNFLHVPRTQPFAVLESDDAVVSAGVQPEFNIDNVLFELPEVVKIAGNHATEIKLEAPVISGLDLSVPEGYTGKVVLLLEGWLFAGGANEKYKVGENKWADAI